MSNEMSQGLAQKKALDRGRVFQTEIEKDPGNLGRSDNWLPTIEAWPIVSISVKQTRKTHLVQIDVLQQEFIARIALERIGLLTYMASIMR